MLDTIAIYAIILGGVGAALTPLGIYFAAKRLERVVERHGTGRCRTEGLE